MILGIAKSGISIMAAIGAGNIVHHAIKHVTPVATNKLIKVCTAVGVAAISGMIGEKAGSYMVEIVDKTAAKFKSKSSEEDSSEEIA